MVSGGRVGFTLLSVIFTSGALLLLFFTLLDGVKTTSPLNHFWYLKANVQGAGVPQPDGYTYWTTFNTCGGNNGVLSQCGPVRAAFGFHPYTQLSDTTGLPATFMENNSRYYLTSRVYFSFLLIGLFFTFLAWVTNLAGIFGRLGSAIAALFALMAFATDAIAASLMTVVFVRGRNNFRSAGIDAHIGVKLFAFMWTVVALMLLCTIFYFIGVCLPSGGSSRTRRSKSQRSRRSLAEKPLVNTDNESFAPITHTNHNSGLDTTYAAPETVYSTNDNNALPRSSYERTTVAGPIDSTATGAHYVR